MNKKKYKKELTILFILTIAIFSAISGTMINKTKIKEIIEQKDNEIVKLKQENIKLSWQLNAGLDIKDTNSKIKNIDIIKMTQIIYDESEKYHNPDSKNDFIKCVKHETGFHREFVGLAGEKSMIQIMQETHLQFTGLELTDNLIYDDKHIIETWMKIYNLYTFTYFDNEKVWIAYNCGSGIFKYFDNIYKIKQCVYLNRNLKYYPDEIYNKYIPY